MISKLKKYFVLSNLSALTGSISLFSILILQKIQNENLYRVISVITGLLFWISLLTEILWVCLMSACRKSMEKKEKIKKQNIGVISFMKTRAGKFADIIFIVSAIILVILIFRNVNSSIIVIPVLSVVYLSFQMHCLYNGRNCLYIKRYLKHNKER